MKPDSAKAPASLRARIAVALIGLVGCFVVPAAVSLVLGMSRLTLTRQDTTVTATVQHLVFFAIPWKTESLSGITRVDHEIIKGERLKRKNGEPRRHHRHAIDNAELILTGPAGRLSVALDPARAGAVEAETMAFLSGPSRQSQRHFLMPNRLFGWLFGIPVTLLALLYLLGATLACLRCLGRLIGMGRPASRGLTHSARPTAV